MHDDEQTVAALNKLVALQEQSLALQKQAFEKQQQAVANQQKAIQYQAATGRIYRISLVVLGLLLVAGAVAFWLFLLWR
jgi:uncharacterized membrane protein